MTVSENAHLQRRVLLLLRREPADSVTAISRSLGTSRESVSRAVNALMAKELVRKEKRRVMLTDAGMTQAAQQVQAVPALGRKALEAAERQAARYASIQAAMASSAVAEATERAQLLAQHTTVPDFSSLSSVLGIADAMNRQQALTDALKVAALLEERAAAAAKLSLGWTEEYRTISEAISNSSWLKVYDSIMIPAWAHNHAINENLRLLHNDVVLSNAKRIMEMQSATQAAINSLNQLYESAQSLSLPRWIWQEEVRAALEIAMLMPSPHMSDELRDEVIRCFSDGKQQGRSEPEIVNDIEAIVLRHYDANDCRLVTDIVERLKSSPWFQGREAVLDQTLAAHRGHLDAISTFPLVLMIEGVTIPFAQEVVRDLDELGELDEFVWKLVEHSAKDKGNVEWNDEKRQQVFLSRKGEITSKPKQRHITLILRATFGVVYSAPRLEGLESVVDFMEQHLYRDSTPDDFRFPGETILPVNRHAIAHAYQLQGGRIDTLRCLLILDLLATLFPLARQCLAEARAWQQEQTEETMDRIVAS